ncbi:response regulator [Paenibacillus sp. 481]|uniref:response regulator n=1 Tax=Paenibacillus sp. 481 TaxID=2835869 RepID=UPI001E620065|nr:response regulator [Paenibacillus sp. 481]UHA73542.1 response regulator [Paenibacillus sp. 481]
MKTMIVDDEIMALRSMHNHLNHFADLEVVGLFQDPREALKLANEEHIDLIFLDIEMPEINGMVLAELLLEAQPHVQIVFVTAYSEYAIEAFEVNALDYILKPVQRTRLAKTLQRCSVQEGNMTKRAAHPAQTLCCMAYLHLRDEQQNVHLFQWRTLKAQELFAYLLHYRGQTVRKESILEWLWTEVDIDKASSLLHTTIYQIRRIIKLTHMDITIKYSDGGYRLDLGNIHLDVELWEREIHSALPATVDTLTYKQQLLDRYQGDYFGDHEYLWAEHERERLRTLWLFHAQQIAEFHLAQGRQLDALHIYLNMIEKYPYNEAICFETMKIYASLGYTYEVKKQYDRLVTYFQCELDIVPSKQLEEWYDHFMSRV